MRTMLSLSSGIGLDGIGLLRHLEKMGMWVTVDPVSLAVPLPADIAAMLSRSPEPPFDLEIHLLPAGSLGKAEASRAYRTVAWTRWDFSSFGQMATYVKDRIAGYDHVVVTDPTSAQAFSELGVSARVVPTGFDPDAWAVDYNRDWHEASLQVAMAGFLTQRKDPDVAISAVQELNASGVPVHLNLKIRGSEDLVPAEHVSLIPGDFSGEAMREFYQRNHVYLSPAWGAAKGMAALEAGTTGCALVLSDVGGHSAWAMSDFAVLLPTQERQMGAEVVPRVRQADLVDALASLALDREKARHMGTQASAVIPRLVSWERSVSELLSDTGG